MTRLRQCRKHSVRGREIVLLFDSPGLETRLSTVTTVALPVAVARSGAFNAARAFFAAAESTPERQ